MHLSFLPMPQMAKSVCGYTHRMKRILIGAVHSLPLILPWRPFSLPTFFFLPFFCSIFSLVIYQLTKIITARLASKFSFFFFFILQTIFAITLMNETIVFPWLFHNQARSRLVFAFHNPVACSDFLSCHECCGFAYVRTFHQKSIQVSIRSGPQDSIIKANRKHRKRRI